MSEKIKRTFGKERNLGDIIHNPKTNSVFCSINLGFFGKKTINFVKRKEDGCYNIMVSKYNSEETIKVGQTFPVKRQDKTIVEGLTQTTLGLFSTYDNVKKKELTNSSDALFLTTHRLREPEPFGDKGFRKVGYVTGRFGIEDDIASNNGSTTQASSLQDDLDDDEQEIPF